MVMNQATNMMNHNVLAQVMHKTKQLGHDNISKMYSNVVGSK